MARGDIEEISDDERLLQFLYKRPGFLVRRTHQIAEALFEEEAGKFGTTPTQHGVLMVLRLRRNLDQIGLSRLAGLDRSSTTVVVRRLEALGFVARRSHPKDARRKVLALTRAGRAQLERLQEPVGRALTRFISVLRPEETVELCRLLAKIVAANSCEEGVPLAMRSAAPKGSRARPAKARTASPRRRAAAG